MDRLYLETKVIGDDAGAIEGVAWRYDQPDRIGDMVAPGAFKSASMPIPMCAFHDLNDPIGTWDSAEDKDGGWYLKGKMLVQDVQRAREMRALVRAGSIKGLSIGFITKQASTRPGGGRLIKELELLEVSLVTVGMHPAARPTSAKSAVQALQLAAAINRAAAHFARS
ncbi:MAG: HK97 family phage prohead protease [Mesorhizobium sp.]|nr:HK97 family phage prohead protease [Mesorhizobium sp.]MBN9241909.1 HK97 family phage prohead protease [Mesorhizobium sp.]